jgi:hypothetical protein
LLVGVVAASNVSEMTTTYPEINILDILTSALDSDDEMVITRDAVIAESEKEKAKEKITPYRTAELINGEVVVGGYVTQQEAYACMLSGINIMCADSYAAYNLVWSFGSSGLIYEINCRQRTGVSYYYHFHISALKGVHIWHYGQGNSEYLQQYGRKR